MADQAQRLRELVGNRREIRVVTVSSGKGGVGKSSITVNLAVALSRLGIRVLVVDADFGLANVDVMLGVTARYNISHFLNGDKKLHDIIQQGHEGVRFISGGSGLNELIRMSEDQLAGIITGLQHIDAPVDFIFIDTGAGINDNILQMILASSETIMVTATEPTALLDAYALVKMIVNQDSGHPIHVLVNKSENKKEAESVQEGFIDVAGKHLGKSINPIGTVMYNADVPRSIKQQIPITVSAPDCGTSREIAAIARNILELPEARQPEKVLYQIFCRMFGGKR